MMYCLEKNNNIENKKMTSEEFVKRFYKEKQSYLSDCIAEGEPELLTSSLIKSLKLDENQKVIMSKIVDTILIDTYYSILLGLDGGSSIGGIQESYSIKGEDGEEINDGDIGGYAYEYFQELT